MSIFDLEQIWGHKRFKRFNYYRYCKSKRYRDKIYKAREMRENPTPAESAMYHTLKKVLNDSGCYIPFWSQSVQGGYILDFYIPTLRCAIEVDGDSHDGKEVQDMQRDENLKELGIDTLRFKNEDVLADPSKVYYQLQSTLSKR